MMNRHLLTWPRGALLAGLLLAGLAAALAVRAYRAPPRAAGGGEGAGPAEAPDPRRAAGAPRNAHPEVNYVGDAACAGCHPKIAAAYRQHPMGRSLAAIREATPIERLDAGNPFTSGAWEYAVARGKDGTVHRATARDAAGVVIASRDEVVHYAVGSGQRGRSYLSYRDGALFQSPLTWYAPKQGWGLSPSYEAHNYHFGRPVGGECLFCHCNHAEEVPGTLNGYREPVFRGLAIGCERCHGPGELHVARHGGAPAEGADPIVNPARLAPGLRDAVCDQCHLQGEKRVLRRGRGTFDFRPGLGLEGFWTVFVLTRAKSQQFAFVGHGEQMRASKCYEGSGGRLGCTSCHDPHEAPAAAAQVEHYRARCLACHSDPECKLARAERLKLDARDDCVSCHMPRGPSDIRHLSVTDHRVVRRPAPAPAARPWAGEVPVQEFPAGRRRAEDPEARRDLGIALMRLTERQAPAVTEALARQARPLLEAAVSRDATDVPARLALGTSLAALGQLADAEGAFEAALARAPDDEVALDHAANVAMQRDQPARAAERWRRALGRDPGRWQHHFGLAQALARLGQWREAGDSAVRAVRLHPAGREARLLVVRCALERGLHQEAERELGRLIRLFPDEEKALRRWYDERRR